MRKALIWLAALVLLMGCGCAAADDYGKAVVFVPGGSLHLREEASSGSASLGRFLTGTSVTLKSEVEDGWVEVKIGRERGYMSAKYLKTGSAAQQVEDEFLPGTVSANKYARMRKGPSTQFQFIRNVNDGENLRIMGETDENWYYVLYKGEKGFISANLIYTSGSFGRTYSESGYQPVTTPVPVLRPVTTPVPGWQAAYRSYLQSVDDQDYTYALIYVNEDSIPELVIDSGIEAQGCRILTYSAGRVNVLNTRRLGFSFIPRGNRLCNSDGVTDQYFDDVYQIRDGRWVCIARGEYYGYLSGWSDVLQRYICRHYVWNGKTTTMDQYLIALDAVFDAQRAVGVEDGWSLRGMLRRLEEGMY